MTQRQHRWKPCRTKREAEIMNNGIADEFQQWNTAINDLRKLEEWIDQMNAREVAEIILRWKQGLVKFPP